MKKKSSYETRQMGNKRQESGSLDLVFSALSDSTRRGILERLASKEMSVTEVASPYEISLPAISRHLSILESAGLVSRRREGRVLYCQINATPLIPALTWLGRYRQVWESQLDSLGSYLDDLKSREVNVRRT